MNNNNSMTFVYLINEIVVEVKGFSTQFLQMKWDTSGECKANLTYLPFSPMESCPTLATDHFTKRLVLESK